MASRMGIFLLALAAVIQTAQALSAPEECWPAWYNASSDSSSSEQCPYGISLPGGVTWNTNMNAVERFFTVSYGYIAYAIPIVAGISALISRGTREVLFILSVVACVCSNEYILKNIILEPKPVGTCAITCGMPSGHSWTTIQYFVLLMVDYAFRLTSTSCKESDDSRAVAFPLRILRLMSNSNADLISLREFCALGFVWGLLTLPVPFSRVMNFDHTVKQVIIGSALGMASGLATYGIYRILGSTLCRTAWQWPRERNWYVLKNTIVPVNSSKEASVAQSVDCKVEEMPKNFSAPNAAPQVEAAHSHIEEGLKKETGGLRGNATITDDVALQV